MGDGGPGGITFNEDERRLFLVLMGSEPPEANPQDVYDLRDPFLTLSDNLRSLKSHYDVTAAAIDGALPDEVVRQFKQTFGALLGVNGGVNHVDEIVHGSDAMADQVAEWSREL